MGTQALLLLNRKARGGRGDLAPTLNRLREAGFGLVEESAGAEAFSAAIRAHRERVQLVIVGGGDGALNAAAAGLVETQLPLGILPLGTANDLARTLNIPTDLGAAAAVIAAGRQRRIDLGWVNGRHFFNAMSIGLGVRVTQRLSRQTKGRWGVLAYALAAGRALVSSRPFRAEICSGGECWRVKTIQIAVGNGRHYGGGLRIAAQKDIADGRLDLCSLEVRHWWHVLLLLPKLRAGRLKDTAHVRTLQARDFQIRTLHRPRHITTDGEITCRTPAVVRVMPRAVSVFVPE
ncbi:MAG: lipid kinase [Gemmataceae bacterium]